MRAPPGPTRVLLLVTALSRLITAHDENLVAVPAEGNKGSAWFVDGKGSVESTVPADNAHLASATPATATPPILPTSYFLSVPPQRGLLRHRSTGLPYVYDAPYVGYPVTHALDHSIGPSSKQLVIVSFIGLLLLFAIIQNTMASVKRREALLESAAAVAVSRDKRDLAAYNFNSLLMTPEQRDILNDDARLRCIQRTMCLENRKLLRDLGVAGKVLAKYLTRAVNKSFKRIPGWSRLVADAGEAGRRGEDCDVLYRDCFTALPSSSLPTILTGPKEGPST